MTTKTKIFVTLAFIGAFAYTAELVIGLVKGMYIGPAVLAKVVLIAAFLFYAIWSIVKKRK